MKTYCEKHDKHYDIDIEWDCEFCDFDMTKRIGEEIVEIQDEIEVLQTEFLEATIEPFQNLYAKEIAKQINELNATLVDKRAVLLRLMR